MVRGPSVSVIIIVKNGEKFLSQAIESALAQTIPPAEIVVVDGQSTDRTAAIAAAYPSVRLVQQAGTGIANARNLGIATAAGRLIAFLDHDDIWLRDKLARQAAALAESTEAEYCLTGFAFTGMSDRAGEQQLAATPSVLLAKRDLFDRIGRFDESFAIGCDAEWFTRARDLAVPHVVVPAVLVHKRLHEGNISRNAALNRREMFRIAKMSIDRRNAQDTTHH